MALRLPASSASPCPRDGLRDRLRPRLLLLLEDGGLRSGLVFPGVMAGAVSALARDMEARSSMCLWR